MRIDRHVLPLVSVAALFSLAIASPCLAADWRKTSSISSSLTPSSNAPSPWRRGLSYASDKVEAAGSAGLLPRGCRRPGCAPDSDIGVEIWLPADQWKGTFHGNGSGGYGGSLSAGYAGMEAGIRRGYASAVTDTGRRPPRPSMGTC